MQSIDVFLSRLAPKVPGCPDPLLRQALVDSAIQFCEETTLIQHTSPPQAVTAGVGTYVLDTPSQQSVVYTLKVWYGTTALRPAISDQIDAILALVTSAGTQTPEKGIPQVFYEFAPGEIGIYPVPTESLPNMLSARLSVKPNRSAVTLDDVLYEDWVEVITAGAAYRVYSIPGEVFSSEQRASTEKEAFWNGITKASGIGVRGRVRAAISTRQRPLA